MLPATALALLITGVKPNDVIVSQTTGRHQRKPSPIISSFLELGRRKLSMQPKFVAAQKMLLNRNPANIRKWIVGFNITLGIYNSLEARVYCSQ